MKASVLILAFVIVLAGAYLENLLIPAVITSVILIVVSKDTAKKGSKKGSNVKVQPIIVKRKYEGPESIYPEEIEIVETAKPKAGWKAAGETTGKAVGNLFGKIWKELFE